MQTTLIHLHHGEIIQRHGVFNADGKAGIITGNLQAPNGPATQFTPNPCRMTSCPETGLPLFGIKGFDHLWILAADYRKLCTIYL